jgi:hypothetical protein
MTSLSPRQMSDRQLSVELTKATLYCSWRFRLTSSYNTSVFLGLIVLTLVLPILEGVTAVQFPLSIH